MIPVTAFSDFACPASYITEAALWEVDSEEATVVYRAFELYPEGDSFGTARFGEAEWNELRRLADEAGLEIRPHRRLPKTRKAHEAALFGRERGREVELRQAIFSAVWRDGRDVERIDVLVELAEGVGLVGEDLRIALDIDRYEEDIEADRALALRLRVPGTPVVFVGTGRSAVVVAGARVAADFRGALESVSSQQNRIDNV